MICVKWRTFILCWMKKIDRSQADALANDMDVARTALGS